MKIRLVLLTLSLMIVSALAYNVSLTWTASDSPNVTTYNIYQGTNTGIYNIKYQVGSNTIFTVSNLVNTDYYFSATANDAVGDESSFSNEASYTNLSPVYIGALVSYSTNIVDNNTFEVMTLVDDGTLANFYSAQMIITNNTVEGSIPNDGNYYVCLVQLLSYGKSLTNMANVEYDLYTFTNPPVGQFYSTELLITNNSF